MPWWEGNNLFLVVFFVICIIACFILMKPLKGERSLKWKYIDLGIVITGTAGLFGLMFQANLTAEKIELPYRKAHAEFLRSNIIRLIDEADLVCVPHPRLPSSPSRLFLGNAPKKVK